MAGSFAGLGGAIRGISFGNMAVPTPTAAASNPPIDAKQLYTSSRPLGRLGRPRRPRTGPKAEPCSSGRDFVSTIKETVGGARARVLQAKQDAETQEAAMEVAEAEAQRQAHQQRETRLATEQRLAMLDRQMSMEAARTQRYTERLQQQAKMKEGAAERQQQIWQNTLYKGMCLRQSIEEGKAKKAEGNIPSRLAAATIMHERHLARCSPAGAPPTGVRAPG